MQEIVLSPLAARRCRATHGRVAAFPNAEAQPLAQLIFDKTGGNPFFTIQFMTALAEEKIAALRCRCGAWRWNLLASRPRAIRTTSWI